ncbi:bile acid:sodium symporter family protein [Lentibacter algarum]|uniref:bile acid:sodium symporter family protein n=1 Tax=Lentibacter algarum TaxID=576131 RepID=UPI001C06D779|nr:bile acid:sodium symporter family protein [Lentibacter algarum]MBU2981828.1 bile acid:sodium symporter family protein [Lentibacter algarum]
MNGIDEIMLNFSPGSLTLLNGILAIVMFSIALDLRVDDFLRILKAPRPVIAGVLSQFLLLPLVTFILVLVMQPSASIALGLILVAACPGGNISNFITHRAGGNTALSVTLTGIATLGAIVLTPVNIAFWGNLYAPSRALLQATEISPLQVAVTVAFMLVLPLCLGIWLNSTREELARKLRRPMQILSMSIFVAFIILALAANWAFFLGYAWIVAGLVFLHNGLALGTGWLTGAAFRLDSPDKRALMIETGIQNSGLGLVLIFGFFNGLGGMAIVAAFWGIWHAISGITMAMLINRAPKT